MPRLFSNNLSAYIRPGGCRPLTETFMTASTPVCDETTTTDLGEAFGRHVAAYRGSRQLARGYPEQKCLNVMRNRALGGMDAKLRELTHQMLCPLADPASAGDAFKPRFMA